MKIIGSGEIEEVTKGKVYRIRHHLGRDPKTGRYTRSPKKTVYGTKADARRALEDYRIELECGVKNPEELTVGSYARPGRERPHGDDGAETLIKQASDAQAALEETSGTIANTLSAEAERLAEHLRTMEESSAGIATIVQKQAADAQARLEQTVDDAVSKASDQISGFVERAMSDLNEGISEARSQLGVATESAEAAASDVKANSDALLEAHKASASENMRQSEETRALSRPSRLYWKRKRPLRGACQFFTSGRISQLRNAVAAISGTA